MYFSVVALGVASHQRFPNKRDAGFASVTLPPVPRADVAGAFVVVYFCDFVILRVV